MTSGEDKDQRGVVVPMWAVGIIGAVVVALSTGALTSHLAMREEIIELRSRVTRNETEITALRADTKGIPAALATLASEMGAIKESLQQLTKKEW